MRRPGVHAVHLRADQAAALVGGVGGDVLDPPRGDVEALHARRGRAEAERGHDPLAVDDDRPAGRTDTRIGEEHAQAALLVVAVRGQRQRDDLLQVRWRRRAQHEAAVESRVVGHGARHGNRSLKM